MVKKTAIVWLRRELRLTDNPALKHAADQYAVIPVFIHDPEEGGDWATGAANRFWLHQSLVALEASLAKNGSKLILRRGNAIEELEKLLKETGANAIYFNERYEPWARAQQDDVLSHFKKTKLNTDCQSFDSNLLFAPGHLLTKEGKPYRVFTPFWKAFPEPPLPLQRPKELHHPEKFPESVSLNSLRLLPSIDWTKGISASWQPGEAGAHERLGQFIQEGLNQYSTGRDRPDKKLVSRMSPHLHFGEISARSLYHAIKRNHAQAKGGESGAESYLRELAWREFAYNLLYHYPETTDKPLRPEFQKFPWLTNETDLRSWQKGMTGYPIVDAGMRELWTTGWMHNRVRMVVASFLVKDLLISWSEGAKWFFDTLVDADLANNTLGWQWTAGCGADAAPYFRIFNPIMQGKKFDPDGLYVRRWVPELKNLDNKWIHNPWQAPPEVLRSAGIDLGKTYPLPLVDHAMARKRALAAFATTKDKTTAIASK